MDRLKLKTSLASFSDSSQLSSFTERLAQSFKTCLLTVQYLCFVWRRRTWFILLYNVGQKQVDSVYYIVQVPAIIHNTCKEKIITVYLLLAHPVLLKIGGVLPPFMLHSTLLTEERTLFLTLLKQLILSVFLVAHFNLLI